MPKNAENKVAQDSILETELEGEILNQASENEEAAEATPKNTKKTKKGYVPYFLQYAPGTQPGDYASVGLNGVNYRVQYGVWVDIPVGVAEILDRRQRQAVKYAQKLKEAQKEECIAVIEN